MLVRFYDILDSAGRYLTTEEKLEIQHIGKILVSIYSQLSEEALARNVRLWKMVPKFHMMVHLCEIYAPQIGNPKYYWCYEEEDMHKNIKEIALSCHPSTVAFMVSYKWVILSFCDD